MPLTVSCASLLTPVSLCFLLFSSLSSTSSLHVQQLTLRFALPPHFSAPHAGRQVIPGPDPSRPRFRAGAGGAREAGAGRRRAGRLLGGCFEGRARIFVGPSSAFFGAEFLHLGSPPTSSHSSPTPQGVHRWSAITVLALVGSLLVAITAGRNSSLLPLAMAHGGFGPKITVFLHRAPSERRPHDELIYGVLE